MIAKGKIDYQVTELLFSYFLFINIEKIRVSNMDNDKYIKSLKKGKSKLIPLLAGESRRTRWYKLTDVTLLLSSVTH